MYWRDVQKGQIVQFVDDPGLESQFRNKIGEIALVCSVGCSIKVDDKEYFFTDSESHKYDLKKVNINVKKSHVRSSV